MTDKQFEPFTFESGDDFLEFFADMHADYASCIDEFADYLDKHAAELENDKCFADFDDYGSSLEQYYRFIYGIMYFESDNIPKEYSEAWGLFRTTVIANKAKLDDLYNLKGVELVTSISDMLTYIEKGNEMANAAMPNEMDEINIGDTITLDFVEITIDSTGVADTILPSRVYSYISDIENEQYFYVKGTIKNLSGETYNVSDIFAQMIFDGKYNYNARLDACAYSNDFFGENVKPLGTVEFYINASIPDELIDTYTNCSIIFGFPTEFSEIGYVTEDDCDYLFKINVKH